MINEWYRQAFEINTSIKLIINPENGNIVDANQAACDFYGYTKDEILHLKISDINCLSKQELIKEMELAKSEKRLYFLFQHKLKSGEIRDVEVYSGPITKDGETLLHSIIHDITEKNKFQRELKKNQAILRAMLDHTTSLIALLDKEGRRIIVNDRISQVFHSNEENLKGTLFWDVPWINYSESQVKKIQKAIKKCSEGIAANIPIEIIINNKTRILELHLNPVKNESNDVEYILAEGIEITERIQFEKDLRSSKQKAEEYSELLNSILESPEGIIVFSIDKNFKYTSFTAHHKEIMKNIWGKDIELGKSILEYITFPEDREKAKKNFQKALKGEHLTIIEEYGDHKLERTYWENRYSPIYSKDNKIKGITVFVLNITDRKKAESDLYLASQVFKQSSEAIMITDRNKELLLINSAFEILTGYSEEEVIGKDPKFLNSNSDDENFYDNIWKIIDSKGNWQGEVFIRKKDGKAF
ncbi:MAG: PAS domain S-box protein, partial [Leptospiraceae bacterium]|nr:PAS domain S-box protein [Leptospiraceae bacterium]